MNWAASRPDPQEVLARLKGFQRDTVEYAFERLFLAPDSTHRFLVADEVGLGKTLVAKGVIARAIDHLWDTIGRIDVVYICSNASIARQNINRLNLTGEKRFQLASRLTLLPTVLDGLQGNKVNFISFTPGTSFDLRSSLGRRDERILLYWLLDHAWGCRGTGPMNLLQGGVRNRRRFRERIRRFPDENPIDRDLADRFKERLDAQARREREEGQRDLRSRFEELCDRFGYARKNVPKADRVERDAFVGELRASLASSCLQALEPDLVILDEFQRFKHLLSGEDEASLLAKELFDYQDHETAVRTLLLSATPYKMYTLHHEQEEDDHYADFLRTVEFLERSPARRARLEATLGEYRRELYRLGEGGERRLPALKAEIEGTLRRVMSRTERLRVEGGGDGMVRPVPEGAESVEPRDVRGYLGLQRVVRALGQPDAIEYWKSAPFLLNFMDRYKLKEELLDALEIRHAGVSEALRSARDALLSWMELEAYERVDPRNARLRALLESLVEEKGAWRLLWLPPAMPTYELGAEFREAAEKGLTKRLLFSAWTVVPKAVATLTSYEVERRIFTRHDEEPENTLAARERATPLLRFAGGERQRLPGMPVLALLYPSPVLAEAGDLVASGEAARERLPTAEEAAEAVKARLESRLEPLLRDAPAEGAEDEAWYWTAPILLDLREHPEATKSWWEREDVAARWAGLDEDADDTALSRWRVHVEHARSALSGDRELGRPPDDLRDVLARMALAGPGPAALRALWRVADELPLEDRVLRDEAGSVAWDLRNLFNRIESMALVRAGRRREPYWRLVLNYSVAGGLSAVLDEYAHVLRDLGGLFDLPPRELVEGVAADMREALSLRTSNPEVDELRVNGRHVETEKKTLRGHFAMRFGTEKTEEGKAVQRHDQVRQAFNSPFWPFVLASTSIGQEGLDFHAYCHSVVHWNLPSNPVDLEQREGRVHRFKGHAIRKNVAKEHARTALAEAPRDPWTRAFERARQAAGSDHGLVPYWIYPAEDGAFIERRVPAYPLSRDELLHAALRRSLAAYRMVFGQPRQDDLMAYLLERLPQQELERHAESLRIELSPGSDDREREPPRSHTISRSEPA